MKFYKKHLRAFTLLECMVALLSISLTLLVFQSMTALISQEYKAIGQSDEKNWQNFSNLMRRELEQAQLDRVSNHFLYVQTPKGIRRFGVKAGSDDFRKTNEQGQGYHPMIYGLVSSQIRQSGQLVQIDLAFEDGLERTFLYDFSEKP